MKQGDFVAVHTSDDRGCIIARFVSDEGETCTVDFGTYGIAYGVPKEIVTLHVSV